VKSESHHRSVLTELIIKIIRSLPDTTADDIFDRLTAMAGCDSVLADYDCHSDKLTYDSTANFVT